MIDVMIIITVAITRHIYLCPLANVLIVVYFHFLFLFNNFFDNHENFKRQGRTTAATDSSDLRDVAYKQVGGQPHNYDDGDGWSCDDGDYKDNDKDDAENDEMQKLLTLITLRSEDDICHQKLVDNDYDKNPCQLVTRRCDRPRGKSEGQGVGQQEIQPLQVDSGLYSLIQLHH